MNATWLVPIVFVFLASSLIWFLVGCAGKWWLKLTMMVITCMLAIWAWSSINNVLGTPKPVTLEKLIGHSATLYGTVVEEPSAIYLWVKMDNGSDLVAYKLPYSRPLHKETQTARSGGEPVRIQFGMSDKGSVRDTGGSMVKGEPEMYILPPESMPPKLAR